MLLWSFNTHRQKWVKHESYHHNSFSKCGYLKSEYRNTFQISRLTSEKIMLYTTLCVRPNKRKSADIYTSVNNVERYIVFWGSSIHNFDHSQLLHKIKKFKKCCHHIWWDDKCVNLIGWDENLTKWTFWVEVTGYF